MVNGHLNFILLPRVLWCWVSFARAFVLLGRLVLLNFYEYSFLVLSLVVTLVVDSTRRLALSSSSSSLFYIHSPHAPCFSLALSSLSKCLSRWGRGVDGLLQVSKVLWLQAIRPAPVVQLHFAPPRRSNKTYHFTTLPIKLLGFEAVQFHASADGNGRQRRCRRWCWW